MEQRYCRFFFFQIKVVHILKSSISPLITGKTKPADVVSLSADFSASDPLVIFLASEPVCFREVVLGMS